MVEQSVVTKADSRVVSLVEQKAEYLVASKVGWKADPKADYWAD